MDWTRSSLQRDNILIILVFSSRINWTTRCLLDVWRNLLCWHLFHNLLRAWNARKVPGGHWAQNDGTCQTYEFSGQYEAPVIQHVEKIKMKEIFIERCFNSAKKRKCWRQFRTWGGDWRIYAIYCFSFLNNQDYCTSMRNKLPY